MAETVQQFHNGQSANELLNDVGASRSKVFDALRFVVKRVRSESPALIIGVLLLLLFILMAVVPTLFVSKNPDAIVGAPLLAPSDAHLFGTDEVGRSIYTRVIYSAQIGVVISIASTAIAFVVGTLLGLVSGYIGGFTDVASMRIVDIFLSFPTIILALFLITVFGRGELIEILAIALVMAPSMARFSRGTGVALRGRAYIESSLISGAGIWHVVRRHLLPNTLPTLLVAASVLASSSVLIAASLSYLGVGTPPPTPSWGSMLEEAFNVVNSAPLYGIFPGICIVLLAGSYIMIGQGLRRKNPALVGRSDREPLTRV